MAGPSQEYIDKMAVYRSDAMGIGPRPSPYHQWIPGIGWTFFPEYDVTPYEQLNAMTGQQLSNALQQGFTHELSANSQTYADDLGITVGSAPAYMGGGLFDNTSYASSPPSADQVQDLYQELLGRQGADQYINAWVNSGGTVDDIRQGIMNSAEYQSLQSERNNNNSSRMAPMMPAQEPRSAPVARPQVTAMETQEDEVDYVKLLRSRLINSLFKDMI